MIHLRDFRESNSLYQKDLAEYLGVSIAFISEVEKGQSKLPGDKLARLIDNDRGWETDTLLNGTPRMQTYNDMKTMTGGQDFGGGQFNAPIYCGKSDDDVSNIIKANIAEYEAENRALRTRLQAVSQENAFLRNLCLKYAAPSEKAREDFLALLAKTSGPEEGNGGA